MKPWVQVQHRKKGKSACEGQRVRNQVTAVPVGNAPCLVLSCQHLHRGVQGPMGSSAGTEPQGAQHCVLMILFPGTHVTRT